MIVHCPAFSIRISDRTSFAGVVRDGHGRAGRNVSHRLELLGVRPSGTMIALLQLDDVVTTLRNLILQIRRMLETVKVD